MKTYKRSGKVFKFRSYIEDSHPILYLKDIDEDTLYDTVLRSLLTNCTRAYFSTRECVTPPENYTPKIPPENIPEYSTIFSKTRKNSEWRNYVLGEQFSQNCVKPEALPLYRNITEKDLSRCIQDAPLIAEFYNFYRKIMLMTLSDLGNPKMIIEADYSVLYTYLKKNNIYFLYITCTRFSLLDYINESLSDYKTTTGQVIILSHNIVGRILQLLSFELEALPKEDHEKMTQALFRLILN